jgi:hypothetical protein
MKFMKLFFCFDVHKLNWAIYATLYLLFRLGCENKHMHARGLAKTAENWNARTKTFFVVYIFVCVSDCYLIGIEFIVGNSITSMIISIASSSVPRLLDQVVTLVSRLAISVRFNLRRHLLILLLLLLLQ